MNQVTNDRIETLKRAAREHANEYGLLQIHQDELTQLCEEILSRRAEEAKETTVTSEATYGRGDEIACPYCGEMNSTPDDETFYDEEEHEATCTSCEKDFWITSEVDITFRAEKGNDPE